MPSAFRSDSTAARLGRALNELEDQRRFPSGHGEGWTGWWDAVNADPGLAPRAAERTALNIDDGSSGAMLLSVDVDALRAAGFAEVGTLWQRGASRLLCAIRLGPPGPWNGLLKEQAHICLL